MHIRNDGNHSFLIIPISDSCLNEWKFYGIPKLGTWDKVCRVQAKAGRITEGCVGCVCLMQDNWLLGLCLGQTQSLKSPFSITMNGSVLSVQGSTLAVEARIGVLSDWLLLCGTQWQLRTAMQSTFNFEVHWAYVGIPACLLLDHWPCISQLKLTWWISALCVWPHGVQ